MTPLSLVLAALATYRVATAIAHEDGPWRAFVRLRLWTTARADAGRLPRWVADGLGCPRCVSIWAALVIVPAVAYGPPVVVGAIAVLAVSGAACVLEAHS